MSRPGLKSSFALLAAIAACGSVLPARALGARVTKLVRYHGYRLLVPASWPVYRLETQPAACVRFDLDLDNVSTPRPASYWAD